MTITAGSAPLCEQPYDVRQHAGNRVFLFTGLPDSDSTCDLRFDIVVWGPAFLIIIIIISSIIIYHHVCLATCALLQIPPRSCRALDSTAHQAARGRSTFIRGFGYNLTNCKFREPLMFEAYPAKGVKFNVLA